MEEQKKEYKIMPYFSSEKELPISFKVNKRHGVYDKIQHYKIVLNSVELKEESLYNQYVIGVFKNSYKIKK